MKLDTHQNRNARATAVKGLQIVWAAALLALVQLTAVAQPGRILVTPDGRMLGGPGGAFVLAAPAPPAGNAAPVASAVTVSGTPTVGQQLTVSFTYTDADSDPAGTHQYQWYRANDATGTGQAAISGATASAYTLTAADEGKYITAGVTPAANVGTSPGSEVIGSTYNGPVATGDVCGSSLTIHHVAGSVSPITVDITYGIVSTTLFGGTVKCAITRNLGATTQATSATDATAASAGWYWQFNRAQGFSHDGTTRTPGTAWISSIDEDSDWLVANDPCRLLLGGTWRLPTSSEWAYVVGSTGTWGNVSDAFNSVLVLHTGGYLLPDDGALRTRGTYGTAWSSSAADPSQAKSADYSTWYVTPMTSFKAFGLSVRCIHD